MMLIVILTNSYTQTFSRHRSDVSVVPVYDDYRILCDKCDKFYKCLHHCTWPFLPNSLGRNSLGDLGCQKILKCLVCCKMCSTLGFMLVTSIHIA